MRPVLNNLSIEYLPVEALSPYAGNARCHPNDQIKQLATSYDEFGMIAPMIVDENLEIIAGHARLEAAKRRGMATVPAVRIAHLTAAQKKAYRLADNKIALNAGWDLDLLALELKALLDLDFDLGATGFEPAEVDLTFEKASVKTPKRGVSDDLVPEVSVAPPVSRPGDIWVMEGHRLICGDARESLIYGALLDGERADAVFTDPPYNVSIEGLVGLGSVKHAEFAMASGEMTEQQFTAFLAAFLRGAVAHCRDGAILFTCMDWRHMGEMLAAGHEVALELKNLCVWNKDNGGMGSFYRSKHELIFVWLAWRPIPIPSSSASMAAIGRTCGIMPASIRSSPSAWTSSRCIRR